MKTVRPCLRREAWLVLAALGFSTAALAGRGTWAEALDQMPIASGVTQLNRSNCVSVLLNAFSSNDVAKALVFLPGAIDELYLFRSVQVDLAKSAPTLLGAIGAMTNQSRIGVTFRPPFLLLHSTGDRLDPLSKIEHARTADHLHQARFLPFIEYQDRDWDSIQPGLKRVLKMDLQPWRFSPESWHFYRHNFAAWNLTDWEALEATALAGKTGFIIRHRQVIFVPDRRTRAAPHLEGYPRD